MNVLVSLTATIPILPACALTAILLWLPTKKENLQIAGWAQIASSAAFVLLLTTPLAGKGEAFLTLTFLGLGLLCLLGCPYKKAARDL